MDRRAFLGIAASAPLAAQLHPEKGKQLAQQILAALGGAAYQRMRTRLERGRAYSFYHQQLSGLSRGVFYYRYQPPPDPTPPSFNGVEERQGLGKKEDVSYVYSNSGAHEITYRGARPMPADLVERWNESLLHNCLYILHSRLGEPGIVFDHKGSDIYLNQPIEKLEIADSEGRAILVYVDRTTKLPVRQSWTRRDPRTGLPIEEVTLFAKFRDIGRGVQWPYVIRRERNGDRIFELYADSIELNPNFEPGLFDLPKGIKVLPERP